MWSKNKKALINKSLIITMVEVAGVEPASESAPFPALHA